MSRSLWEETASPAGAFEILNIRVRAEVAVVGGGFTGLSAALHLAESGRDVVLLEAAVPGAGASGRNGGQVIPGIRPDPDELETTLGPILGPRVVETVGSSADVLFDLIARHGIDCDVSRTGWIQAASTEAEALRAQRRVQQWRSRGATVEEIDATELRRLIGGGTYRSGWIDRRGGSVQPLSLSRGLARVASRAGVRIFGGSAVIETRREGDGWTLLTAQGEVRARSVVIGTNGYTGTSVAPRLSKSLVPVYSMQIATAPLSQEQRDRILPAGQTAADMRRLVRYFRMDRDGRFVIGSRGPFKDDPARRDAAFLQRAARRLFPSLAETPFLYRWSGRVAMTGDHVPHLSRLAPGMFSGMGYNGRGVAMATLMGKLLAEVVAGGTQEEIGFPITPSRPLAFHALHRPVVKTMIGYHRLLETLEKR